MKISNMISSKGNTVPNQFIIVMGDSVYFKSYDSVIAEKRGNAIFLDETYWNYSRTTSKYRSQYLGESTKDTQARINNGTYKLTNLNG